MFFTNITAPLEMLTFQIIINFTIIVESKIIDNFMPLLLNLKFFLLILNLISHHFELLIDFLTLFFVKFLIVLLIHFNLDVFFHILIFLHTFDRLFIFFFFLYVFLLFILFHQELRPLIECIIFKFLVQIVHIRSGTQFMLNVTHHLLLVHDRI